ncbi:MAG: hypothetical protein H7330_16440 [Hymenobacteraceae bacterium]|nr:hypothetical protein [Hymenobacteraceae bacterium]
MKDANRRPYESDKPDTDPKSALIQHTLFGFFTNSFTPPVVTDSVTGHRYHELPSLYLERPSRWLECADQTIPSYPSSWYLFYPEGTWASESTVMPVVYILPQEKLTGIRLKVRGHRMYHDQMRLAEGSTVQQVAIQYDRGRIFFGKRTLTFDLSYLQASSNPMPLVLNEITETDLLTELAAL